MSAAASAVDDALEASPVAAADHGALRPLAVFGGTGQSIVVGIHGWAWGRVL